LITAIGCGCILGIEEDPILTLPEFTELEAAVKTGPNPIIHRVVIVAIADEHIFVRQCRFNEITGVDDEPALNHLTLDHRIPAFSGFFAARDKQTDCYKQTEQSIHDFRVFIGDFTKK
jgi:hypothetical protein